jgi:ribosomal protein L44E
VRTTGDLVRFGCALRVECTYCHSSRTLSGAAAVASLRLVELGNVAKRFRCTRCGMKAAKIMVLPPV